MSIFKRGCHWYAYYRLDGRSVRRSLKTTSKKQARTKAAAIERDIINGEARRTERAPLIEDVIEQYVAHLRAKRRSEKTITKYQFAFKLMLEIAAKRGIRRIDQLDLAFIDAFELERGTHRFRPKKIGEHVGSQVKNDPQ